MRILFYFFFLYGALLSKELILTEEEKLWLENHPVIHVGGEMDWAPFDFVTEDGTYNGISHDYLKLLRKNLL